MRRIAHAAVYSLAALGLLVVLVTVTPLAPWWAARLAGPWTNPKGDTLIVVGGSILGNGMIGDSSYWRAIYGALSYVREASGSRFQRSFARFVLDVSEPQRYRPVAGARAIESADLNNTLLRKGYAPR